MEGVALDSIILFVALVTAALLLFYLSRKLRSNQVRNISAIFYVDVSNSSVLLCVVS